MAQIKEEGTRGHRVVMTLRQRPWLIVLMVLVIGLLVGSAVYGVVQASHAGGFTLVRNGSSAVDEGSDDELPTVDEPGNAKADGIESEPEAAQESESVVVDVSGAVVNPSVVELQEGDRVQDAIEAAGGLAADADVSGVNRAAKLVDGQQVYIPRAGEATTSADPEGAMSAAGVATGSGQLININIATVEELDELPGVGPSTAQAIVDERTANGSFATIEDLMRVTGIGEKKFDKLKPLICV